MQSTCITRVMFKETRPLQKHGADGEPQKISCQEVSSHEDGLMSAAAHFHGDCSPFVFEWVTKEHNDTGAGRRTFHLFSDDLNSGTDGKQHRFCHIPWTPSHPAQSFPSNYRMKSLYLDPARHPVDAGVLAWLSATHTSNHYVYTLNPWIK